MGNVVKGVKDNRELAERLCETYFYLGKLVSQEWTNNLDLTKEVQLGAFSVRANAERLWSTVSGRAELAGHERMLVPAGRVVRATEKRSFRDRSEKT